MNYRSLLSFVALAVMIFTGLVSGPGCANIVPPQGGFKDTLAPVIRRLTPADSTLNFNRERIEFVFDEYIDLDNPQQNLIVSPVPKNTPVVTRKLNTMTVRIRDTLEPNTTYSINFGNTIKDVNEGNILKNYTYIFSTGDYFDSLQLRGKVLLAESGGIDTTITVMLHRSGEDSALFYQKPRYIAKVDNQGNFRFRNLPKGTFYIYAIKSEGAYNYMSPETLFAFADSSVQTGKEQAPITLYAYAEPKDPTAPVTGSGSAKPKAGEKRLKFLTNLREGKQDLLSDFVLTFETPLKTFDSTKVRLTTDSTFTPVTGYHWIVDSTRKTATLKNAWKENTPYHLILEKEFATDTLNQQLLKADTVDFYSNKNADYGKLSLRFKNLDLSKNPVLLFLLNNDLKGAYPLTSPNFTQQLFLPGEYTIRILEDRNKNGKWDAGKFYGKHIQPEIVKPIERKIVVKANWENEAEVDATAAPSTEGQAIPGGRSVGPGVRPPAGGQRGRQ
ncbi:MAG: hypothetical protein DI535_07905 [Citrobacter freundii]|nr:MAG: hypothetical protein DI535_07905 [Citrobacter freundii]